MRELHHFLTAHFIELSGERSGLPLYFIEHGLSESDTEDLILKVSEKCSVHPLTSFEWQLSPLPIIIAATEVGYSYQGPGHDFWPKFDERLGIITSFEEHISLSKLFVSQSRKFGGASRPSTPWARNFPHIAWPITHAALPLEFHRPFAKTLSRLNHRSIDLADGESLYRNVLSASRDLGGVRFRGILEDERLVLTLVRHFLRIDEDNSILNDIALDRISEDIRKDQEAYKNIKVAVQRRVHAEKEKRSNIRATRAPERELQPLTGRFWLRKSASEQIELEASMPTLPPELLVTVRRVCDVSPYGTN